MDTKGKKPFRSPPAETRWLRVSRVAVETDYSVRTVKRWIEEGRVDAIQMHPNGEWRISRDSLDAYLASLRNRCFAPGDEAVPS
jgi:excisionase family DNA binding protein